MFNTQKIVEYQIAVEYSHNLFQQKVTSLIGQGFQPYGSMSIAVNTNNVHMYVQPMVKYESQ